MTDKYTDAEVTAALTMCSNQFGPITEFGGGVQVVRAVQALVRRPTPASWERARRFFVSWEGERYTLARAVAVFASVEDDRVPSGSEVMAALRAVSS